jgi:cell division protein FtsB
MRRHHRRPVAIYLLLAAVLAAGGYLSFELGRFQAGYSVLDVRREIAEYQQQLESREQAYTALERQVAVLETSREIDRETYAHVEADLADLQARIQAQQEELEFYRGIVTPADGTPGVRVQGVELLPQAGERIYLLKFTLVQATAQSQDSTGVATLRVEGMLDGAPAAHGFAELPYRFRYFQGMEAELELPEGFAADRIELHVVPSEPRSEPVTAVFRWSEVGG